MGSGSSSSKQTTPTQSGADLANMTQPSSRGSQSRGRRNFEEVEFQDPNARPSPQRQPAHPNGSVVGMPPQINYGSSYGGVQPVDQYRNGYNGYGQGPQEQWQYAGNAINTQQHFTSALQSHYQQAQAPPTLAPQPNQDPDEFLSMALQMQEMVGIR